jgi:hypothetical protein
MNKQEKFEQIRSLQTERNYHTFKGQCLYALQIFDKGMVSGENPEQGETWCDLS